jgi:hypothetical protein
MSAWASRPRVLPPTGRRKGTHRFCPACGVFHPLHRAVAGEQLCAALEAEREIHRAALTAGPTIRRIPRTASR